MATKKCNVRAYQTIFNRKPALMLTVLPSLCRLLAPHERHIREEKKVIRSATMARKSWLRR